MNFEDAIAGTFHQKDGIVDPNSVVAGYIGAAQKLGIHALTRMEVTGIRVSGGEVEAVETTRGRIQTHSVLNAAGPWAGQIGQMAGVDIPIVPMARVRDSRSAFIRAIVRYIVPRCLPSRDRIASTATPARSSDSNHPAFCARQSMPGSCTRVTVSGGSAAQ